MVSKYKENIFDQFGKLMESETVDNDKIEKGIVSLLEQLGDLNKLELPNQIIKDFFEKCAAWILKNFSSVKLNSVINLLSIILTKLGYRVDIKKEGKILINLEIIELLQLETYEQLLNSEKKEKTKEILTSDGFISNPFLAAFYALILTISNKPEIILKSRNLLRSILTVLSQICEIDNIAIYYKKKRLISVFMKIIKELKNSKENHDSLLQVTKLVMHIFAKIGKKRPIYRDYMFKKAIPEKLTDIYTLNYQKDSELNKVFPVYCFFTIRIGKLFLIQPITGHTSGARVLLILLLMYLRGRFHRTSLTRLLSSLLL
jgi:hypothetical protein